MDRRFKLLRQHPAVCLVAIVILAAIAVSAGWLPLTREAPLRFTGVTRVELPLPPGGAPRAPVAKDLLGGTDHAESVRPDLALLEDGPFGPLPKVGPDGRRPFLAYAHPFNLEDRRPKVAVLLLGVGLQRDVLDAALTLPTPISLQFSAYTPELPAMVERARRAGHEVLLDLPMEPADDPAGEPGPHTLLAGNGRDENLKRLDWLLAQASGYVALAGSGARFAGSDQAVVVLDELARRGLALIEVGGRQLAPAAAAAGLPYTSAQQAIDDDPALAIDDALAALEAQAVAAGSALGVAQGHPESLERLRLWTATLEDKGLVLAPVSAVLIEQAGLARDLPIDGQRAAARPER